MAGSVVENRPPAEARSTQALDPGGRLECLWLPPAALVTVTFIIDA
jgi:hypothetical protein